MTAAGVAGTITFDGVNVTIEHKRPLQSQSVKRIPVASISAIEWKPPTALVNGYIEFTILGGVEHQVVGHSRTMDATQNENALVFTRKQQPQFEALRDAVDASIAAARQPAPASPSDQIAQLAALHQQGILSDTEFSAAKAKLLGI